MACQNTNTTSSRKAAFFDLDQFFKNQISVLNKQKHQLEKKITLNGVVSQKKMAASAIDYEKELNPFIVSNINKTAWLDSYKVDTVWKDQKIMGLNYEALADKLRTQKVNILFSDEAVAEIKILNQSNSMLASSKQELTYRPKKGYFINSIQKVSWNPELKLDLQCYFLF